MVADDKLNSVSQYEGGPLIGCVRDGVLRNWYDFWQ